MEGLVLNFNTHPDRSRLRRFRLPGAGHAARGGMALPPPYRVGAGHAVGERRRGSSRALNFEKAYRQAPRVQVVRPCAERRRSTRRI